MEALLLVAEQDGPQMFARIGIMKATNRHVERVFDTHRFAEMTPDKRPQDRTWMAPVCASRRWITAANILTRCRKPSG